MKKSEKRARGKTNPILLDTVIKLNKTKSKFWAEVAEKITRPTRQKKGVPLHRVNKHTKKGDVVVVPGKVLGNGNLDHSITIAAEAFTQTSLEKIKAAKGKATTLTELAEKNKTGNGVKIIG